MSTLLIVGSDAASSWLGYRVRTENVQNVHIYIDNSTNLKRVIRLLRTRRLKIRTIFKLFLAENIRKRKKFTAEGNIATNSELIKLIQTIKPNKILCFRAGLIINRSVLDIGIPVFNIHVSNLPDFPGLGTIERSIKAKKWEQNACLHYIDEGIDTGKVINKEPYFLLSQNSYKKNEDIAYLAGVNLAMMFLTK